MLRQWHEITIQKISALAKLPGTNTCVWTRGDIENEGLDIGLPCDDTVIFTFFVVNSSGRGVLTGYRKISLSQVIDNFKNRLQWKCHYSFDMIKFMKLPNSSKLPPILCPRRSPPSNCLWLKIIMLSGCWLLYIIKMNNNTNEVILLLVNIKMISFWKLIKPKLIYGHLEQRND